ncbi:MAG TPA: hypothetical protein VIO32_03085 [Candidatus Baltobacteraceae bacterium]
MVVRSFVPLAVGIIALALAACGGTSSRSTQAPVPCPLAAGAYAIPAPPDLLYPMPGATGVPDGDFTLVVGYSSRPPQMQLVTGSGVIPALSSNAWGPAPSPMPSPAATPRSSSETLYGLAVPALSAQTTYTAQVTFGNPPCQTTESAGSFTTR